jgi:hypothetical protein
MLLAFSLTVFGALPQFSSASEIPVHFQNVPPSMEQAPIATQLRSLFGAETLREIKVRPVVQDGSTYLIVRLRSAKYHKFETVKIQLLANNRLANINRNYRLQTPDRLLSSHAKNGVSCPDDGIEFISFAPNDDDFEQGIARDVANNAKAKGLKTVLLLGQDATRTAYLNYMSCPNLKGNFYDGDSNPSEMITADDSIMAEDFKTILKEKFRFKVTNIWLACEAFNDPMLSSVTVDAQAQKYAAGINDLLVGPSDHTAACAMEAAINGEAMTAAFHDCYQKLDDKRDQWGFDGRGSDFFGQ